LIDEKQPGKQLPGFNVGLEIVLTTLSTPGIPKLIADKLKTDIDDYAIATFNDGHRWHLGGSLIGHECSRYLWYVFRWVQAPIFTGRMLRLFNRGHLEEIRNVGYLRGIGCQVWTHDESKPKKEDGTYPQFRINAVNGHFGGSLDGILKLPETYGITEPLLAEFKTAGTGRGFTDTIEKGVAIAKNQHYNQMCVYGAEWAFEYGAYFITNKNDDDLEIQIVKLDWNLAEQLKIKAERIITSQEPPPKLSLDPTMFKCKYCEFNKVCHAQAKIEKNCRSCKACTPTNNGEFYCNVYNGVIPRDVVKTGCEQWNAIV
jgi:hypothetical protein